MQWSFDRAGYPLAVLPDLGWSVHLLPVAKAQFERVLAEPRPVSAGAEFGDAWYEHLLEVSPRVSPHRVTNDDLEMLFATGLEPGEGEKAARWFGPGFELPRVDVWRAIDDALHNEPIRGDDWTALIQAPDLVRSARLVLERVFELRRPSTWGQAMLLKDGLLEWVRTGPKAYGGLGRPRSSFSQLILNPQRDAPVRPIRSGRHRQFGIRLTRPLSAVP